jgi:hypothetical protein
MMGDAFAGVSQQIGNVGIHEGIPNSCAFLASADYPRAMEYSEMLGDVLLYAVDSSRELLDRCCSDSQLVQQLDSERLAEDAEPFGDEFDEAVRFHRAFKSSQDGDV